MISVVLLMCFHVARANDIVTLLLLTKASQSQSVSIGEIVPRVGVITDCVFDKGPRGHNGGSISLRSSPQSHVAIVNYIALKLETNFTVIAWVKIDTACNGPLFEWIHPFASASMRGASLRIKGGRLRFSFGGAHTYIESSMPIDPGQWIRVGVSVKMWAKTVVFLVGNHTEEVQAKWENAAVTYESVNIGASPYTAISNAGSPGFQGNVFCLQLWRIALDGADAVDAAFWRCEPLNSSGQIALWPLDYKSGLLDISANKLPRGHGSNITFDDGPFGNRIGSIKFGGASDNYLEFSHPKLKLDSGTFTVLAIIKTVDHVDHFGTLFEWYNGSKQRAAHIFVERKVLLYNPTTSDASRTTQKLVPDRWTMVGITYDAATNASSFYIDGQIYPLIPSDNKPVLKPVTYPTVRIGVGKHLRTPHWSGYLNASVACVQLWSRTLTAAEISLAFHQCATCCNKPTPSVPMLTTEKPTSKPPKVPQCNATVTNTSHAHVLMDYIVYIVIGAGVGGVLFGGVGALLAIKCFRKLRECCATSRRKGDFK